MLKFGSEDQPGKPTPSAVNPIADVLAKYGGVVLLRGFIYGDEYASLVSILIMVKVIVKLIAFGYCYYFLKKVSE